jgi:hypothetical protein
LSLVWTHVAVLGKWWLKESYIPSFAVDFVLHSLNQLVILLRQHDVMGASRALPLMLGTVAAASGIANVTFDIIFAVTLSRTSSPASTRVTAIIASGVGSVAVAMSILLLIRQIRYRNGAHIQDFGHGRQHTYLLAGFAGVFGILSSVASATVLGIMRASISELPKRTIHSSTKDLIVGGFIVWAVTLVSQVLFVVCMVIIQRRDFQQQIRPYRAEDQTLSEMQEASKPQAHSDHTYRGDSSMESRSPPSSSGRSSFRSSLTHVVRPITSKTKLINNKTPHRPTSLDSSCRDVVRRSVEDGFDSWDTSAVDAQSREAVESASSPTVPRFLETIPASPTTSRSASPGFPLDLEPPKQRQRSRSYSPACSQRDLPKSRTTSPAESSREAHIHPLFRTDSPTPPPAATPGTMVTAAPGAGQLISDRASIRSIRLRSGSLPSSPIMHHESLDSIRQAMEKEDREKLEENGGERTLTPPIPDWILSAGSRSSMSGYNSRKKTQAGLGKLGEPGDA